jgi:hypothetical protein
VRLAIIKYLYRLVDIEKKKTNKKKGKGEVETQGWAVCSPPYVLPSNKKKI